MRGQKIRARRTRACTHARVRWVRVYLRGGSRDGSRALRILGEGQCAVHRRRRSCFWQTSRMMDGVQAGLPIARCAEVATKIRDCLLAGRVVSTSPPRVTAPPALRPRHTGTQHRPHPSDVSPEDWGFARGGGGRRRRGGLAGCQSERRDVPCSPVRRDP
jgi:hypothetical protein